MTETLTHRGPDDVGFHITPEVGLGLRRLAIVAPANGHQPISNEDGSLVLVCNGEIYGHQELRAQLIGAGHRFKTGSDVEVLLHLYEERGLDFLEALNGQFAVALYDARQRRLVAARDHFGVAPFFYTLVDGLLVFGSEIKALLEHPGVERELDLLGLDQVLTFPGLISPRTMFQGVQSLPAGQLLVAGPPPDETLRLTQYWDLAYPREDEPPVLRPEGEWVEELGARFRTAVARRLRADVPVGFYLSGGLDSSLVAATAQALEPGAARDSFSVELADSLLSEGRHQRFMAARLETRHHTRLIGRADVLERLARVVWHCECALKETFNAAALALSEAVRAAGLKVVLAGQGADELFGGYVGYRFDRFRDNRPRRPDPASIQERQVRKRLWGDPTFLYEREYHSFHAANRLLYAPRVRELLGPSACLAAAPVAPQMLERRDPFHQRSYVDVKCRLQDHLLGDHGDRMCFASSVEARYPFLDRDVVELARRMPVDVKLKSFEEKHIIKRVAEPLLPPEIVRREKFGFTAPGSPWLLQGPCEPLEDLLSHDRIRRQGVFDPQAVEALKVRYREPGFRLNVPFDADPLMVVITTSLLLDTFRLRVP